MKILRRSGGESRIIATANIAAAENCDNQRQHKTNWGQGSPTIHTDTHTLSLTLKLTRVDRHPGTLTTQKENRISKVVQR